MNALDALLGWGKSMTVYYFNNKGMHDCHRHTVVQGHVIDQSMDIVVYESGIYDIDHLGLEELQKCLMAAQPNHDGRLNNLQGNRTSFCGNTFSCPACHLSNTRMSP